MASHRERPGLPAWRIANALAIVLVLVLALVQSGCTSSGGPDKPASEAERLEYQEALAPLPGDPQEAMGRLEDFLRRWPRSPLADDAGEKLASLALESGDSEKAAEWLRYVISHHEGQDRSDSARLALARLEAERGDDPAARRALDRIRFSRLSFDDRQAAYRLLVTLSTDPVERLRWLSALRADAQREADVAAQARLDAEIDDLLASFSAEELARASDQLSRRIPAARVRLRVAERAIDAGDFDAARDQLDDAARLDLTTDDEALLEALGRRYELRERLADQGELLPTFSEVARTSPPRTDGAVGTVGVVLPLSGAFARYGEESLRGALLAAQVFDSAADAAPASTGRFGESPGSGLRIAVRDSGGTRAGAARAVRDLGRDPNVVAIVGPLLSEESDAAAIEAQEIGVPLLTLTSREEVPRDRDSVFRLRTTPKDEVTFLVDYATRVLGARRFAVLYPADDYGRGMRQRFWQAVVERGGSMVAVSSYDPDATDFEEPIRRMVGYVLLTRAEETALKERDALVRRARRLDPEDASVVLEVAREMIGPEGAPLPPIVDFDALFIPDSYEKVALIAPQLAFNEVTGVQLLGSDGWNDPALLEIARDHVDGAAISTLFDVESQFRFVQDFVESYTATYDEAPGVFAANAFDATNLVLVQLAAGRDSREAVRDGVLRTNAYPGASGVISVLPDGNARKRPFMIGVERGEFVSLDDEGGASPPRR